MDWTRSQATMLNDIALVLPVATALTFLLPVGFRINLATSYPMDNSNNNLTITNTTNFTSAANVTAGETLLFQLSLMTLTLSFFDL